MPDKLDPELRSFAMSQICLFVFVGHDSTSSIIHYAIRLSATHPDALGQIREEHDKTIGKGLVELPSLLENQPQLTKEQLPCTTAVIKESLRPFAPGSCSCASQTGVVLVDDNGNHCPTEAVAAGFTVHTETHGAPAYWKQPDEFLPERWLVELGQNLHPFKGAYRAYEIGPRNCVARDFVLTELRVILSCFVRQFDFYPVHDEWDKLYPNKSLRYY